MEKFDASNYLSRTLIEKSDSSRYVVSEEDRRVGELLKEPYSNHEKQEPRTDAVRQELEHSRKTITDSLAAGIDDAAIDARLGLHSDESVLPPMFIEWRNTTATQQNMGSELTFLKWMSSYATDEQLLNVWQWHDDYLTKLDNDPAFQERLRTIRERYKIGAQLAVEKGVLDSKISYVDPAAYDNVHIVHGSIFSPMMTDNYGYVDHEAHVVQVRDDISDYGVYHELTHALHGGLPPEFNEGLTELISAEIYNGANQENPIDLRTSSYTNQIASVNALMRMTQGEIDLPKLSRMFAGKDRIMNGIEFVLGLDKIIGAPVIEGVVEFSRGLAARNVSDHVDRQVSDTYIQFLLEFIEKILIDETGKKYSENTFDDMVERASRSDLQGYPVELRLHGLRILSKRRH